jgi:hypothetical protein
MFLCGDGLTPENICFNNGVNSFIPKSLGECQAMIDATRTGSSTIIGAQKCPVVGTKAASISHYEEYKGCNLPFVTKYDVSSSGMLSSTCNCGKDRNKPCGPSTCSVAGGSILGAPVGALVGAPVGTPVSAPVGSLIGTSVGAPVGVPVSAPSGGGSIVGALVGSPVGGGITGGAPVGGGSVGGDPHFKTHDGTLYSFHGECDLVMAQSPSFSNGVGLDVHARTEMIGNTWSLVSNAAVRIGNDIFEVNNNGTHFVNGIANAILPAHLSSDFEIHYAEEIVKDGENSIRSWYTVELGNGEKVQITNYKKMISVNVEVKVSDMVGMLGSTSKPGLVGRNGNMEIVDPDEMGSQWQVNDEEPMLFNDIRSPQYPEACKLPEVSMRHRRLGSVGEVMTMNAKAACSGVAENLYSFCLYDVMISGNTELAQTYNGGVF